MENFMYISSYYFYSTWHRVKNCYPVLFLTGTFLSIYNYCKRGTNVDAIEVQYAIYHPNSHFHKAFTTDVHSLPVKEIDWCHNGWQDVKELQNVELQDGDILEVGYNVYCQGKCWNYVIPYTYPKPIQFPPYSLEETLEHVNSHGFKKRILGASFRGEDITMSMKPWEGPKCNFHADLPGHDGVKQNLIVGNTNEPLFITDSMGHDHVFYSGDMVSWNKPFRRSLDNSVDEPPRKRVKVKDETEKNEETDMDVKMEEELKKMMSEFTEQLKVEFSKHNIELRSEPIKHASANFSFDKNDFTDSDTESDYENLSEGSSLEKLELTRSFTTHGNSDTDETNTSIPDTNTLNNPFDSSSHDRYNWYGQKEESDDVQTSHVSSSLSNEPALNDTFASTLTPIPGSED